MSASCSAHAHPRPLPPRRVAQAPWDHGEAAVEELLGWGRVPDSCGDGGSVGSRGDLALRAAVTRSPNLPLQPGPSLA